MAQIEPDHTCPRCGGAFPVALPLCTGCGAVLARPLEATVLAPAGFGLGDEAPAASGLAAAPPGPAAPAWFDATTGAAPPPGPAAPAWFDATTGSGAPSGAPAPHPGPAAPAWVDATVGQGAPAPAPAPPAANAVVAPAVDRRPRRQRRAAPAGTAAVV
ncbi:MAG TPA: hypothetical protein VGQ83_31905, partial [Polyangia bacterium]